MLLLYRTRRRGMEDYIIAVSGYPERVERRTVPEGSGAYARFSLSVQKPVIQEEEVNAH